MRAKDPATTYGMHGNQYTRPPQKNNTEVVKQFELAPGVPFDLFSSLALPLSYIVLRKIIGASHGIRTQTYGRHSKGYDDITAVVPTEEENASIRCNIRRIYT